MVKLTGSTPTLKKDDNWNSWYLIDATDLHLGRLAAILATYLQGKHKPTYVPYMDHGDYMVVVNVEKIHYNPNKPFYWHTGYPGGIKSQTAAKTMEGAHPWRVLERAVKRMLPKGPLGKQMLTKLRLFAGPEHKHHAQNPQVLPVEQWNDKNHRSRDV